VKGDHTGEDGKMMFEELELWHHNPVECIQELLSNPALDGDITYTPVQCVTDKDSTNCVIDEGWTAGWWWKTQTGKSMLWQTWYLVELIFPGQNSGRGCGSTDHSGFRQNATD
jgi:hypothetical protein